MKFDMHCHTKEGSLDGKVKIEDYIRILRSKGFDGMLVTDHDSYKGYKYWKKNIAGKKYTDFVVLKGIEYDTIDAGHILVVLPQGENLRILELRGLPVELLIEIVHAHGGILGPAHPYGEKYLSFINTMMRHKQLRLIEKFDFVEAYNACEEESINKRADKLSKKYNKPGFGGSDAHKADCCGLGYTTFDRDIFSRDDLIAAVKDKNCEITSGGTRYGKTTKDKLGKANAILVGGFKYYNRGAGLLRARKRQHELKREKDFERLRQYLKR